MPEADDTQGGKNFYPDIPAATTTIGVKGAGG